MCVCGATEQSITLLALTPSLSRADTLNYQIRPLLFSHVQLQSGTFLMI